MPAPNDTTAIIERRLRAEARTQKIVFGTLLEQFALSRFLARLSQSEHKAKFVLKGAQLFRIWTGQNHRPTRDVDFLGFGDSDPHHLANLIDSICALTPEEPDALEWLPAKASPIREENSYGGTQLKIMAQLGKIRIPLQIDIGFGDAITPGIVTQSWPGMLGYQDSILTAYPAETVIAEKLEAMIHLGMVNSRMKDFYDLHWLSNHYQHEQEKIRQAIHNTFQRRQTPLPQSPPIAFTKAFYHDPQKISQWKAFLKKSSLNAPDLEETILCIEATFAKLLIPIS